MAQIFGYFASSPRPEGCVPRNMGAGMRRPTQGAAETWLAPAGTGMGALLGREFGTFTVVDTAVGAFVVALDGRIVEAGAQVAEDLVVLYRKHGAEFVRELKGSFALAIYDTARRRLLVATDRFATRSVYWAHVRGAVAFGSELKGFLAVPGLEVRPDPHAVASYLRYGRLFGKRTIWQDVRRLPPATVLEYDVARDAVAERTYWQVASVLQERRPLTRDRLDAVGVAFREAVQRGYPGIGRVGLSLSGGLDSRAVVAVMAADKRPAELHTGGLEGCMDARVGRRIAALTGLPWRFAALTQFDIGQYVEAVRRYVYLTEGMMVPDGFPGTAAQRFAVESDLAVLQRGHGGENARVGDAWPFQVDDGVLAQTTRDQLVSHLEPGSARPDATCRLLFRDDDMRRALDAPEDSYAGFARELDAGLTPAEALSLMYLQINEGNTVAAYRNSLRGCADMALPYLDADFLDVVLGTRVADRRDATIHYHIIRTHCPALMKVANSNNGTPLNASRLRRLATEKLHGLLRRVRWPGFRHYHYMEAWIRECLLHSVRALLLEPRTLERGLYDPGQLSRLIEDSGDPAKARLLTRLVTLETWLRMFVDREVEDYQPCFDTPADAAGGVEHAEPAVLAGA